MTDKEIQEKLLGQALAEAKLWLVKIPKLDEYSSSQRILDSVVSKFKEHQVRLWNYKLYEVADHEFEVHVNMLDPQTLILKRKEEDEG